MLRSNLLENAQRAACRDADRSIAIEAIDRVDPFIGCEETRLPEPQGLAAAWWWPKAQIGNTHPGAVAPWGMVSACPYSGAYPTGYGLYAKNTDGKPGRMFDRYLASGFTHFHQTGTGAIRKYYNYVHVTPTTAGFESVGRQYTLEDEAASPGYYRCRFGETGVVAEVTAAPRAVVYRYTFPKAARSNILIDCAQGGIASPYGRTVPTLADVEVTSHNTAQARLVVEGVALYVHIELDREHWKYGVWFDGKNVGGGRQLVFDHIRESTLKPFGVHFGGPTDEGEPVELRLGFSWRSAEQAQANLEQLPGRGFDAVHAQARRVWGHTLDKARVTPGGEPGDDDAAQVFSTALYHACLKPSEAAGESPFWPGDGPFYFDFCTMWDIYKTQLPLIQTIDPQRGADIVNSLLTICEQEGNFPIGYRMARGADRFFRQASALAHVSILDARLRELPGIDWDFALTYMDKDLQRGYGEDFLEKGVVHPLVHTLDLAYGCYCTARLAQLQGDKALAERMAGLAGRWRNAYDESTGLLRESTYYEGRKWNYSFRFLHDMPGRVGLAGGPEKFCALLDRFFGYDAGPVAQLGLPPHGEAEEAGYRLNRFEGLNNEPDMEAPYAYLFAGRHDRCAEVVQAGMRYMYAPGRGGLPGNDDSGAMSSWYVWSAMGLFPVAGQDAWLIGSPRFPEAELQTQGGPLRVLADGLSSDRIYVAGATWNGEAWPHAWLPQHKAIEGGELRLTMSDRPNGWGATPPPMWSLDG
ncbi:MAG: glycoside hydrolase domain-containing protein [Planctomycetota bacterium]